MLNPKQARHFVQLGTLFYVANVGTVQQAGSRLLLFTVTKLFHSADVSQGHI